VGDVGLDRAGAISALFGLAFLPPLLTSSVASWSTLPDKLTLWAAGNALISTHDSVANQPSTGLALLVCATYVVLTLGTAGVPITRRDA
jgi:hypothetical protein